MRNQVRFFVGLLAAISFLFFTQTSYADRREKHRYQRYHDRPYLGMRISTIPGHFFTFRLSDRRYYYCDGVYYNRFAGDYVVVAPPLGAVVRSIPSHYRPIVIGGVTYYEDNGTYYIYTRKGFEVVSPLTQPVVVGSSMKTTPLEVSALSDDSDLQESFTVHIPNNQGGYIAVLLKRAEKGFLGPQGEFYPQFPKVSQLKAMYGN